MPKSDFQQTLVGSEFDDENFCRHFTHTQLYDTFPKNKFSASQINSFCCFLSFIYFQRLTASGKRHIFIQPKWLWLYCIPNVYKNTHAYTFLTWLQFCRYGKYIRPWASTCFPTEIPMFAVGFRKQIGGVKGWESKIHRQTGML